MPIDAPRSQTRTKAHLAGVLSKFTDLVSKVGELADPQCAHSLLRSCLGPGKILYSLRTCDVSVGEGEFLEKVEAAHRGAFESVVGGAIADAAWNQACLPMRL